MAIDNQRLEALTEADLQTLIGQEERKKLEFKQSLPGNSDGERKEFLADFSSFANAVGGDLLFGVEATNGIATRICGLGQINADAAIQRLESMALSSIAPRIPGVELRAVPLAAGGPVIVARIPRSWAWPHMITFQHSSRFFSRSSVGKYPLDVFEIRTAFAASDSLTQRVRDFRIARLAKIVARETPGPLPEGPALILHLVPFSAFTPGSTVDISGTLREWLATRLYPLVTGGGWNHRFNFDGFVTVATAAGTDRRCIGYAQLFRDGCVEAVDLALIEESGQPQMLAGARLETLIVNGIGRYLSIMRGVGAVPPIAVILTLVGVREHVLYGPGQLVQHLYSLDLRFDRDDLLPPIVLIEQYDAVIPTVMKPVFDAVWNAGGYPGSPFYDQSGIWQGGSG